MAQEGVVGKFWKLNILWLVGEKLIGHSGGSNGGEERNTIGRRGRKRQTGSGEERGRETE
jgi:hypothetical protein